MFNGIGVSPGIGLAPVVILKKADIVIPDAPADEGEKQRYDEALEKVLRETERLAEKARQDIGDDEAAIFEAHAMIIQDPELSAPVYAAIDDGKNAAAAVEEAMSTVIEMFEMMDDEYMRERAADMRDIKDRLLRAILGVELKDISRLDGPSIIAAHDLTPSDTANMDRANVVGILTETGGRTAHSAIMARSMEIPAVVGCNSILVEIADGVTVAINGDTGDVEIAPDASRIADLKAKIAEFNAQRELLKAYRARESVSKDGRKVEIAANIGTPDDAARASEKGADGVGLFRSEFLYMDRGALPTEDEQFEAYKAAVVALKGKPVIVRTLDIGGDKKLPALPLPEEENPFLGYRAIRISLDRADLFETQLRALLRASAYGNLLIMFPMISSIEELRAAKAKLEECKNALRAEGVEFDPDIKVGIMVEIPATAVIADLFARECDFFSIGTNDLIQYTTAVDRGNEKISHLYSQYHPAVLRLIDNAIKAAHESGIFCGMCGEAAGDELLIPALLGMGLDEFSMSTGSILPARKLISELSYDKCKLIADAVLRLPTAKDVKEYLMSAV